MSRLTALARRPGPPARAICVNPGPLDSKTDQTAQTDQRVETQGKFGASPGWKPTTPHLKLTSGSDHGDSPGTSAP